MSITRQYRQYCENVSDWHTFQTVDDELSDEVEPCPVDGMSQTRDGTITLMAQVEDATVYSTEKLGLVVSWASNSTVDVDATKLGVEGTLVEPVNVTIDITASGANGLDTDSEASSTGYYVWIIAKSTDGSHAGLLSLSATAPTMPSGYDLKRMVGWIYNNSAGNIYRFYHCDDYWWFNEDLGAAPFAFASTTASTWQDGDPTALIPSICTMVKVQGAVYQNTGGMLWNILYVEPKGANWSDSLAQWNGRMLSFKDQVAAVDAGGSTPPFDMPLGTNRRLSFKVQTAGQMTGYLFLYGFYLWV